MEPDNVYAATRDSAAVATESVTESAATTATESAAATAARVAAGVATYAATTDATRAATADDATDIIADAIKKFLSQERTPPMYRQGDVLLIPVSSFPAKVKPCASGDKVTLALGEVTGHAHVLPASDCQLMIAPDNLLTGESAAAMIMRLGGGAFLEVARPTCLTHEEHASVAVNPGTYKVTIQREYSLGESRVVRD